MAEKILDKKELEFYKWDAELSQLLQNVRKNLNQVANVRIQSLVKDHKTTHCFLLLCREIFQYHSLSDTGYSFVVPFIRAGPERRRTIAWRRHRNPSNIPERYSV